MNSQQHQDDYKNILQLAEQGNYQQAFEQIQSYLNGEDVSAEVWNDAGAIAHCLGNSAKAVECFQNANKLAPADGRILSNLAEAYLAIDKAELSANLFDQMSELKVLNPELINRTATALLNRNNKAKAIETLLQSLELWPQQHLLNPMIEVIKSKRPRIAFFCGADGRGFVNDIIQAVGKRFNIKIFDGTTQQQLYELMQWCDIAWFEWCTNLAAIGSNKPKCCKTIIRLHRYEAYSRWPEQINWSNIDMLITTGNQLTVETLKQAVPDIESTTKIVSVANAVNLNKFKFISKPRGKNIAFLANLRMVKNPAFLIQCMQKLNYIDKGYKLFIAGNIYEKELGQYLKHMIDVLNLQDAVIFEPFVENVPQWLADKHYIVSTSIIEGQPVGILEAMACGLKPVVHNYPAATDTFDAKYLFDIAEQFCQQITEGDYSPVEYRKFVEDKFALTGQLEQIYDLLSDFEKQLDSEKTIERSDNFSQEIEPVSEMTFSFSNDLR